MDTAYVAAVVLTLLGTTMWLVYLGKPDRYSLTSPMGVFFAMWFVFLQLPGLILYPIHYTRFAHSGDFILAVAISPLIVLMVGGFIAGRNPNAWKRWWHSPTCIMSADFTLKNVFWALAIVTTLLVLIVRGGNVPLFQALAHLGAASYWFAVRWDFSRGIGFLGYLMHHSERLFLPAALTASLLLCLLYRRSKLVLSGLILLSLFITSLSLHKVRPARLTAALILAYMLFRHRKFRLVWIAPIVVAILLFPTLVHMYTYSQQWDWGQIPGIYERLADRLFVAPTACLAGHFAYVPDRSGGFLYGQTIATIAKLTGRPHYPIDALVAYYVGSAPRLGSSIANAAYPGTAWADWGWFGIIGYSAILGLWLGFADRLIRATPKTPIVMALAVCTTVQVLQMFGNPLQVWMVSFGGIANLLLLLIVYFRAARMPIRVIDDGHSRVNLVRAPPLAALRTP
ncbi:MAG TPA: hypothetical protein VNA25_18725 [Phycisphaerae bacterium]|nr:hypothetical protein [Phycisphaerae bacterium]